MKPKWHESALQMMRMRWKQQATNSADRRTLGELDGGATALSLFTKSALICQMVDPIFVGSECAYL